MKKALFLFIIFTSKFWAQAPQQINYQGLARDAAGVPISSLSSIGVIFTIADASNAIVHLETQPAVPISTLGLFSTKIGLSPAISNTITWQNGPYTLSISIDAGAGFNFIGSQQLVSVPFALYAKSAGNASPSGTVTGQTMYWEQPNGWKIDSHLYNDGSHVSIGSPLNTTTNKLLVVTAAGGDSAAISGRHYNSQKSQAGVTGLATGNFPVVGSNFEPLVGGMFYGINTNSGAAAGLVGNGKSFLGDGFGVVAIGGSGSNVLNVGKSIALYAKATGSYYPNKYAAVFDSGRVVIRDTLQLDMNGSNGDVLTRWFNGKAIWAPPAGANSTSITSGNSNITVLGVTPSYTISSTPSLGLVGNFLSISNGNTVTLQGPTPNTTLTGIGSTSISGTFPTFTINTPTVSPGWSLLGNAGTNTLTNFIGTTDANDLFFRVNNQRAGKIERVAENVFFGYLAGPNISVATANTGIGFQALNANTSGTGNTAIGYIALPFNSTGDYNTAIGGASQLGNTTGGHNVSLGYQSLRNNITGSFNVAIGNDAIGSSTASTGENVAVGAGAMYSSATGSINVMIGRDAGALNINGSGNVFLGNRAGYNELGSNKLYIANSAVNPPLIYGDFSTGSVGIGTTSPSSRLHVTDVNAVITVDATGGGASIASVDLKTIGAGTASLYKFNTGRLALASGGAYNMQFLNSNGGSFQFDEGGNTRLYIQNGGNVGINTNAPSAKLDVNGTALISGTNANELNRTQTGNANLVPIAYGNSDAAGTLFSTATTTNITLASHVANSGQYNFTIAGESFFYQSYVVSAVLSSGPGEISFNSVGGDIVIQTFNSSGVPTDKGFTFVVYKK